MKKRNLPAVLRSMTIIFCGILIIAATSSCKKDTASTSNTGTVTEADASQAITEAIVPSSGGMAAQTSNAAYVAAKPVNVYPCGQSFDSSILLTNAAGAAITYNADLEWNWILSCSTASFTYSFKGHTTYEAPLMSSNDTTTAGFVVTGLDASSPAYILNANYVRNGSQQSNIGYKNSFTSLITINSANINIDKTTEEITSGTATVSISGASTSGKLFSYSGTIVFLGNQAGTLTMASGNVYRISW